MNVGDASALVTGGASGLGLATATALAAAGARVTILDLPTSRGAELPFTFVPGDVRSESDVQAAIDAEGDVRIVVNCAGIATPGRAVGKNGPLPLADFERVVGINLVGTFNVVRLAAARMMQLDPIGEECGVIVNTASVAAFDGQIGQAAYSASKGGIVGMTLPIARDLSAVGIRVNTVAPGLIDTPIYGTGEASEQFKAHLGQSVLFPKRLGSPEELAFMVVDLITNPYLNAEVVRVDGGIRMPPK